MLGTAQRMALDFREGWNGGFFVLYFGAVDPKTGRKRGSFLLLVDILSEHNSQGCTRMVFHMGAEMQICGPYSTAFLAILAESCIGSRVAGFQLLPHYGMPGLEEMA